MGEQGTITAKMGLDNKPLVDGLRDSVKHASDFADRLKAGFDKHAFEGMTKGLAASRDTAGAATEAVGGLFDAIKVGGAIGSTAISAISGLFTAAIIQSRQMKNETHGLIHEFSSVNRQADFGQAAEGVEVLGDRIKSLHREQRKVTDEARKMDQAFHPIKTSLSDTVETFRHFGVPTILRHPIESFRTLRNNPREVLTEETLRLNKENTETQKRLRVANRQRAKAIHDELTITEATLHEDEVVGKIEQERLATKVRISKLRRQGVGEPALNDIQAESNLRIQSLRAQESFKKLDIAAEFQKAQLERPGIGLTQPEVQGAQLFRQREDIQQQLRIEPSAAGRAKLNVQADVNRNQIEEAEFQQLFRRGAKSGRGNSGGGMFHTADEGLRAFAKYRERIQDTIRNDPALRNQLDVEIGKPFAFQAPRQTQLMPSTQGPTGASDTQHDISGGRSLNDIYTLIDKKWQ